VRLLDRDTQRSVEAFIALLPPDLCPLEIRVFGSRARQDHRSFSDVDVAIILSGASKDRVSVALSMADVAFDVMLDTGILVEALPLWEQEWRDPNGFFNPALIERIKQEGIRV
jgi:uncharacterized protein